MNMGAVIAHGAPNGLSLQFRQRLIQIRQNQSPDSFDRPKTCFAHPKRGQRFACIDLVDDRANGIFVELQT